MSLALLCPPNMCGIAGIAGTRGARIDPPALQSMIDALVHRGPDERGIYIGEAVGLAHTRLSIIDVADGHQPMSNDDASIWVAFNGEIFNFVELRRELIDRGIRFRTRSDTEVLLRLYEAEGSAAVHRLNGQWAFAIWDARSETLLLSRDRMGVRPLFYASTPGRLLFASEIKALLTHPAVSRELDPRGLDNVFTFWSTLSPRTIFRDVHELPPGHVLTWHAGRVDVRRYWQPTFQSPTQAPRSNEEDAGGRLLELLTDATRLRLRADVPVGAYLSGGLDSSVVAALAARQIPRLRTFSLSFEDAAFDESSQQRELARALGTDHHELRCSNGDVADAFPEVIWHAEQPVLRTAAAPMFLLSRLVRDQGYKVVLTGEGADEVLGGYDIFKEAKIRRFWARSPGSRRRALLLKRLYPYLSDLHRQPAAYLKAFFHADPADLGDPFFSHRPRWSLTSRLKVFFSDAVRSALRGYDGIEEVRGALPASYDGWDPLFQAQYLEATQLLPGYILSSQGDRAAMAHGVEARHPFLDRGVVDFAAALPPTAKLRVLDEKHVLKAAARGLVPETIRRRPKQPYRAPDGRAFFAGPRTALVDDLLSPAQIRRDGVFNADAVERLVRKFREGRAIGIKDDMALVGILSTQLVVDRFVNQGNIYGHVRTGSAQLHR